MKRILHSLLITLVILSAFGIAAAATTKAKKPKKTTSETEVTKTTGDAIPGPAINHERKVIRTTETGDVGAKPGPQPAGPPIELSMKRAASRVFDLRNLPQTPQIALEREEREEPEIERTTIGAGAVPPEQETPSFPTRNAPAPATLQNFDGMSFALNGNGHPPDTNGDVGPNHYIQTINTSIGIYQKNGTPVSTFSFNTFMSQGAFGNLCDTNNFGDPVVLYDTFEDRWIITDFAFTLDGGGNVINPPGNFQCVAVSKSGDPVSGGWNFYSINTTGGLGDYPKFGIWPDGLYMTTNLFAYPAGGAFQTARAYAFNKAQMYAGKATVQVISFNIPGGDFTVLPSNARLQTGTPPPGTPNFYSSTELFLNALAIYKFHVDWTHPQASTFSGPDTPLALTSWPSTAPANAPSLGGNALDTLAIRNMMENQYSNIGGAESLWNSHTVRRQNNTGFGAPRWYQVDVTGGTVAPNMVQGATFDPDGANVIHRFMPSVEVDRAGDMALGYSTSSTTTKPAMKYAGRLVGDPINTLPQTEQVLIQGTGTQLGNCGTTACTRWGDYSAMTLDPDGCTFWYTNEYYAVDGLNHQTRIGSFAFPSCTPVGVGGTLSGTVTALVGGAPIAGANVQLGARSTTTNGSGFYTFSVPAGTYPNITVTSPGYVSGSANGIVVTDGNTTTQDFALALSAQHPCLTDTTQADFQAGDPLTNVEITSSPGDVKIVRTLTIDQKNNTLSTSGVAINIVTWGGQTFTPAVTGPMFQADINLFCSGCTGTFPNLTLSLRATSANLPTGPDLTTATIAGFNSGAGGYFTGVFSPEVTLTAGTTYALIIRPTVNPSAGTYALTRSATNVYAGGQRVTSGDSGATWAALLTSGQTTDAGFDVFMDSGFISGTYVSGVKDSNPGAGLTPVWSTLSFTTSLPANTSIQFQVAGSNSDAGPFNFVGPDNTAGTFFTTSGASLAQFAGLRYLKYKAFLASSDSVSTPSLSDVTICVDVKATPVVTATGGIFTYDGTPQAGGGTATGGSGESLTVTLTYTGTGATTYGPTSTAPTNAGTYQVVAHTDGDVNNLPGDSAPAALTINKANPTITATGGTFTYNGNPHAGSGSATGGGAESLTTTLTYDGTGSTTYGPSATAPSLAGTYTVTAHTTGDANNNAGDSSATALTINKFDTLMAAMGGTVTYDGNPHAGSGQALGGAGESLPVTLSYQGISGTTYGPSPTPPTNSGVYLVTAHTVGDANNNAEDSLPNALRINKATATIVVTGYCVPFDGSAHTASGTATGVLSESLTGLDLSGTTHTAAGTYLGDAWSFTNANYSDASGTVNDGIINANITTPATTTTGSAGNLASVANAGSGASYAWSITGGTITAGAGTTNITYTAGATGTLMLNVAVTLSFSCGSSGSANVTVNPTVTSVSPTGGTIAGGSAVTINGTGFNAGATVTFGGSAATSVVVVSSIKITARTPAHALGAVNVTVTNADTTNGTLAAGYLYKAQQFDPNNDTTITTGDIFYLINFLYLGGPPPSGAAGLLSGDANGDGLVDSADIFYLVNYLFLGGPRPNAIPTSPLMTLAAAGSMSGSIALGKPAGVAGHYVIPVVLTSSGSTAPQAMSLKVHFDGEGTVSNVAVRKAGAARNLGPAFEISRQNGSDLSYVVSYDSRNGGLNLGTSHSAIVAEIEIDVTDGGVGISVDPSLTMLSDQGGMTTATVANGKLKVSGTTIMKGQTPRTHAPGHEVN